MVSLSLSSRVTQWVLAAASLGISGKLIRSKSELTSQSSSLSSYTTDLTKREYHSDGFYIDTDSKGSSITIAASSLTTVAHPATYAGSVLLARRNGMRSSSVVTNAYGISKKDILYFTSLATSESGGVGLWFTSAVYQLAQFGSWSCDGVEDLLTQYNLTGDIGNDIIDNFFGYFDLNVTSLSNITDISYDNMSALSELQSKLLIDLSSDCSTKKSSVALSILACLVYFYTSSKVTSTAIQLISNIRAGREDTERVVLMYEEPTFLPTIGKEPDV